MADIGKLIIVTGFFASGKDSVVNYLLENHHKNFSKIITHTSRPIRTGEKEGFDHYFVSKTEFERMITNNELIEHVTYESNYKGTSKSEINKIFNNIGALWRIDMERAATAENLFEEKYDKDVANTLNKNTVKILLKSESEDAYMDRYYKRDPQSFDRRSLEQRLEKENKIYDKYKNAFEHVIENKTNQFEKTMKKVLDIISK